MNGAQISYRIGNLYPYDDTQDGVPDPHWTVMAARGVLADLQDRQGIKHGFVNVDCDIRAEIVARLAEIILLAYANEKAKASARVSTADDLSLCQHCSSEFTCVSAAENRQVCANFHDGRLKGVE
jgi:hypothetical protein